MAPGSQLAKGRLKCTWNIGPRFPKPELCAMTAAGPTTRRFCLVLIKPSHYDDDGYVIQWWRSSIPSNSLSVVYTLAEDAARRRALGPDVELDIVVIDETRSEERR